ncbi:hypothetical protein V8E55_012130 [Tylopilus felleus]
MAGLTIAVRSVAGETATIDHLTKENCDKIWKTIVQTPSRLRKKIKHQTSAGLQKLYGLLPPLNTPAKDVVIFWKRRVRTLLTGNKFLKEPGDKNSYLFYLSIFTSLMTEQFEKGLELWRWFPLMERSEDLDTVYALCTTAISQALKDYWDGRYNDRPVTVDLWYEDFIKYQDELQDMRNSEEECSWLDKQQNEVVVQGWATLGSVSLDPNADINLD